MTITRSRIYTDESGPARLWVDPLFGLTAGQTLLSVALSLTAIPVVASGASSDAGAYDDIWVTLVWTTGTPPPSPSTPRAGVANLDDVLFSRRYFAHPGYPLFTNGQGRNLPYGGAEIAWSEGRRDALLPGEVWLSAEIHTVPGEAAFSYRISYEATVTWDDNNLP